MGSSKNDEQRRTLNGLSCRCNYLNSSIYCMNLESPPWFYRFLAPNFALKLRFSDPFIPAGCEASALLFTVSSLRRPWRTSLKLLCTSFYRWLVLPVTALEGSWVSLSSF
ncbi:hypothetical protein SDJN02_02119, partial [Cucurbita argyrosperma subsp. argyrosperma]